jgi:4-aminobutyrate aminotransferase-like enzyme/aminoglycoside phosphotransferase (APT) family kinase protein
VFLDVHGGDMEPTMEQLDALLAAEYGLTGTLTRLPGENRNFLLQTASHERYVLKLVGNDVSSLVLDLEHQAMERVRLANLGFAVPRHVPTRHKRIEAGAPGTQPAVLRARLLEFVPGTAWNEAGTPSDELLHDLGQTLASLDVALAAFSHPAAHRTHSWDPSAAHQHRKHVVLVDAPPRRQVLEQAFHLYAACAAPQLANLPHSVIHADANNENVLVQDGRVSGLLDFGDCLYAPTVCELAVALAYAMLDLSDPLRAASQVVAGYHARRTLSIDELQALFPLICGRLAVSVSVAAQRRRIDPSRDSWFVSEEPAWRLLESLVAVDPDAALRCLSEHTDVEPSQGGAPVDALLERRRRRIGRSLSLAYCQPLKIARGAGQYLYDHRGRPFLDLVNNVCHVGHCHPRVVEAAHAQMRRLNTNTRYLYDGLTDYAERLCATLPSTLDTCFLVNSGSEANELALRLAMAHTGREDFLVVDGAYHGHTSALTRLSPYKFMGPGGTRQPPPGVHVVPTPDGFRGRHAGHGHSTGIAYGDEIQRVLVEAAVQPAGFLAESLLSCAGQIIPPAGYLETAYRHVRTAGGVCIADEVQVGFGRVGTHFWAFETQNVVPDIVVMGKPIGNGHPMAAVVTTEEIAASFANGMEFFATFGGNPVSCAVGLEVLNVIRDEKLQEHALKLGRRFLDGLRAHMQKYAIVGDVRGAGLFIGVELVSDRGTLQPAADAAATLVERLKERGILLSIDGPLHNVIKIKPPMVLTADDVDMAVRAFGDALDDIGHKTR